MLLLATAPSLTAQVPRPPLDTSGLRARPDTTRPGADTTRPRADTAAADTLSPDSLRPLMPTYGPPPGPLPQGRRYVFDYDAIRFSGALTLGELLARIPGVYLVRAGWFGEPEQVAYAGQGPASLELDWDGWTLQPLGIDSLGFDTGRFPLGLFRRIEVEVLPTVLRVHLVSDQQATRRPRTEVAFATGDGSTNGYRVRYLNHWGSGVALGMGVSYFSTSGLFAARARVSDLGLWLKGGWMPTDRVGVEYQLTSYGLDRDPLASQQGSGLPGVNVRRRDSFVHAFVSSHADGRGLRLDAFLGSSSFSDSSRTLDQHAGLSALIAGYRASRWSLEAATRVSDGRSPLEVSGRIAASPVRRVVLTAEARRRTILGGRWVVETSAGAEVRPLPLLRILGDVRRRRIADSALSGTDSSLTVTDWSAGAGLAVKGSRLDVLLGRHGLFVPPVFGVYAPQLPTAIGAAARIVSVSYEIPVTRYLTVSGWYRHPLGQAQPPFEPPHHSITRVAFRSRFLPHFRRGVFDVLGQMEYEAWGTGIAGADSTGGPIALKGKSVFNFHVEVRLVGAVLFWTWRNPALVHYAIVPGLQMPRSAQRFGLMWEFTN